MSHVDRRQETGEARPWHHRTVEETLAGLGAGPSGLTEEEAAARRERWGPNELVVAEPTPGWRVFLRQFTSPLVGFLLVCAVVTAVQRHWVDTVAILAAVVLNAVIGHWQERKAETEVRALQSLASPSSRVLRGGALVTLAAADLVPGDLVLLESGDRVPADLRLVEVNGLRVDESMLTGEVLAVDKSTEPVPEDTGLGDRLGSVYSGALVVSGRALGVVVATGARTELGAINALVQGVGGTAPLQGLTRTLERRIGVAVASAAAFVFVAGFLLGNDLSLMFRTAVALVVSAMPEALPVVLTVALSVGVAQMARRNAVIRHLPSVETLGSTTVIGSDKTGTLTQNKLTVEAVWTTSGTVRIEPGALPDADPVLVCALRTGALTNEAEPVPDAEHDFQGDAVDAAMAAVASRLGAVTREERSRRPLAHTPYEPELGYSQSVHAGRDGRRMLHVKGAPDAVLAMSTAVRTAGGDAPLDPARVHAANEAMAREGLRVLATALRVLDDDEVVSEPLPPPRDLVLLGLEGMADPPRPGVPEAVAACRDAGIDVKMITGDHPATALAVAERLGLDGGGEPLTGAEMAELDDEALDARLRETSVAARTAPRDKMRIVERLLDRGHVVAVTGDGVNDAPALKAASIGVAMGRSGTDVAREAADLVLTDDNFVTIVHAVEQGRITFATIRKATFFLLSTGVAALLAVTVNVFTDSPLIFLPVQMLWMNLVTSGIQVIALAFEPGEGDELRTAPRPRGEGVLDRTTWVRTLLSGAWMAAVTLAAFQWALHTGSDDDHARTVALSVMVVASFFQVLNARALRRSVFQIRFLGNKLLTGATLLAFLLHLTVTSWPAVASVMGLTPLTPLEWLVCSGLGGTVLVLVEVEKLLRRRASARRLRA
ncbi:ATPase [Kocuria dechangensis]|uniref:ATPase n=1 Tax=Kocuria dechangensis TaxID=1176249 RepID=A0A917H0F6_9MICC|nr:HAD-IC family P-type ATPase [Kocuria dechangensis]GGG63546.1 ATPase [Kocuria dechangensis]